MAWRLGIDIGGTFTDVALVNDVDGTIGIAKTPTTPSDFGKAVLSGLHDALDRYGVQPDEVSLLSHATTVVTNSILEENGARTALISTRAWMVSPAAVWITQSPLVLSNSAEATS